MVLVPGEAPLLTDGVRRGPIPGRETQQNDPAGENETLLSSSGPIEEVEGRPTGPLLPLSAGMCSTSSTLEPNDDEEP